MINAMDAPRVSIAKETNRMAPFSIGPTSARIAGLHKAKDPGWVFAGPDPPGPPQFSKASTHTLLGSSLPDIPINPNDGAIAGQPCAVGDGIAPGPVGGLVAAVLPLSDAPPASSPYGPVAPAWAQRHPWIIFAWAWLRALRWLLRDFWRAI